MFLDDFRPWRCQNVVNTSVFSFTSTNIAQNTVFLDVFDLKYLTRNNNNNNNKKNIWHLWSLVRADPAAERREYEYYVCVCFAQCLFGGETRHLFFCLESSRSLWSARCWSVADFTHPASEKWNVAGSWRLVARVATFSDAVSTNEFFIDNNRQIWESYVCNSCYSYNQTAIWPGLTTSKWEFLAARAFQPILNISITHVTVTHFWPEPASCFLARDASMASYMMVYLAQDPHFRGFICLLPNLPL